MSEPPQPPLPEPNEATTPSVWMAVSPALRAALFAPEHWRESLEAYAHTTNLAVILVDVAGHPLGPCLNPQPTWSRLHVAQEAAATALGHANAPGPCPRCPFVLGPDTPCTCVNDALARRMLVLRRDRAGLVHFTVPLVLEDHPVGALLAGQVFDQYPEQSVLEHVAKRCRVPPEALWQAARLEVPVKRTTLRVYSRLLAALGNAFLHTRYHTILDAQRLAALEQRFQERTAALHHEIAERQRLEHEAQRVQHFALLGQLAAGVSHEIRNPLGAVVLHVDLLAEELQQPTPDNPAAVAETLAEIKTNLARVEDLVQDYLSLVRVGSIQLTLEDLGAAVQAWTTEFHALAAPQGVTLRLDGLTDLGLVTCHTATLRRAVLNLVQNALEAMPQGGTLTFTGRSMPTHVQLQVRDTGSGIPAAQHAAIFEPLYTTKPAGTGLGLYIVQEIVAAHGGHVTVESVEGQGTTFTLTLPRAAGEPGRQGNNGRESLGSQR
jgi:signal transduction histidine kinase